jgi:hypothetical protein
MRTTAPVNIGVMIQGDAVQVVTNGQTKKWLGIEGKMK